MKFTGKNMPGSLFLNKLAGMKPATLFKKEALTQAYSLLKFQKFLRTLISRNTSSGYFCYF